MPPLLFLCHRMPYPPNKGDKVRSFNLLKHLSTRYDVYLGTFIDDPADLKHKSKVEQYCAEAYFSNITPAFARTKSLIGYLKSEALSVNYYSDAGIKDWVDSIVERRSIHKALIFSSAMAQYVLDRSEMIRVMDFVDVDSDKWRQYADIKPWPLSIVYRREAHKLMDFERDVATRFDSSVFVTPAETRLFAAAAPECAKKLHSIGNGVDASFFSPSSNIASPFPSCTPTIVFTGAMDYWPNIDAVRWFAKDIFPGIVDKCPNAQFYVVGMNPSPKVRDLSQPNIIVTGRVPDVRPYLQHATVVAAPLRIARGIQNKVLEAMAMKCAVVVSRSCMPSLSAVPGTEIEDAESEEEFATKVVDLLKGERRHALGARARTRVLADYAWETNLLRFDTLLNCVRQ